MINTSDYEKLGSFYLGREVDPSSRAATDDLVLYDSRDLVTHGLVLGMTGSGKTGLCISMLEEAAMDNIPALVIDPKGDIANLFLTFPDLAPEDFKPWVNEDAARRKNLSVDEFAAQQADLWKTGLAKWGQDGERIRKMREKVDLCLFTPGSSAGIPVSILGSLTAPEAEIRDDTEAFGDRVESTATSLLGMLGINADPLQSREHILVSAVLSHYWTNGQDLDLPLFIQAIQNPPFDKVGVLSLDQFFSEDKRFELTMKVNNLLAAPGFAQWLEGPSLDIDKLLYSPEGKPRVSILSIAHLSDHERMFIVSMILNQMVGWMRRQQGTTSLRALLYMDEIFGFLPPTANPPSKKPLMTLLKQARAFGVGTLLATQNPVDLDYKALSNIGTWFIGRLQTERDQARVMDGLQGAADSQGGKFDRAAMEKTLAGLGSRVFLLHNVHEDHDMLFETRWAMSYLSGPLSRPQIKRLIDPVRDRFATAAPKVVIPSTTTSSAGDVSTVKPKVDSRADEFFLAAAPGSDLEKISYTPYLLREAEIAFDDKKTGIKTTKTISELVGMNNSATVLDEDRPEPFELTAKALAAKPTPATPFGNLPEAAGKSTFYTSGERNWKDQLYREQVIEILSCPELEITGALNEERPSFQAKVDLRSREIRDERKDELRIKYAKKLESLEDKIRRAEQAVEREEEQASASKRSSLITIGQSILGALFGGGRSRISSTKIGTAGRSVSRAWQQHGDIDRAEDNLKDAKEDFEAMEKELNEELEEIERQLSPEKLAIETTEIRPYKKDVSVTRYALVWRPE